MCVTINLCLLFSMYVCRVFECVDFNIMPKKNILIELVNAAKDKRTKAERERERVKIIAFSWFLINL